MAARFADSGRRIRKTPSQHADKSATVLHCYWIGDLKFQVVITLRVMIRLSSHHAERDDY